MALDWTLSKTQKKNHTRHWIDHTSKQKKPIHGIELVTRQILHTP